jgi:hypothetical protein
MAKVGLFAAPPKKWFQFDEDTEVLIEHADKEDLSELTKKAEEKSRKFKANAAVLYDIFFGRKKLHGWRKIKEHNHPGLLSPEDGAPIEFTPQNRDKMMMKCQDFSSFVFQKSINATNFIGDNEVEEGEEKDLETLLDRLDEEEAPN